MKRRVARMVYLLWGLVRSDAGAAPMRPRRGGDRAHGVDSAAVSGAETVGRNAARSRAKGRGGGGGTAHLSQGARRGAATDATPLLFEIVPASSAPAAAAQERTARPLEGRAVESVEERGPIRRPRGEPGAAPRRKRSRREQYEDLETRMRERYRISVRRWRTTSSGVAWETHRRDGTVNRWIEAPYPRGPMSCAIFLHEVGHHAIGFHRYRPRCLEEYHAWRWAIETMEAEGFDVTDGVRRRMHGALEYAVAKALRRGIRRLPDELLPFMPRRRGA